MSRDRVRLGATEAEWSKGVKRAEALARQALARANTALGGGSATPDSPRARLSRSSNQSIPHNTVTTVTLPNEVYRQGVNLIGGNGGLRIVTPGLYLVTWQVAFASSGTASRRLAGVMVNGGHSDGPERASRTEASNTERWEATGATELELDTDDELALFAFQNTGDPLNVAGTPGSYLTARRVADTL